MAVETHEHPSYSWPKEVPVGAVKAVHPFHGELTATQLDGDATSIIKLRKLSEGRIPVGFKFLCDDLDSGGTPALVIDLVITDGSTTKVLIDASTIAQAGGLITEEDAALAQLATWFMLDFIDDPDWYLAIRIDTAAATAAAGTVSGFLETIGRGRNAYD